ncbi:MAG TPA: right-handed parallel beta-helix repeat-containing protein [Bacteroidales bacterium]
MKNFFGVMLLTFAFVGCQKDPITLDSTDASSAKQLKASTTVTTEAALKSAISAAKAGDVITISGTIKLTSTLQLLNSGTSSSKINLTGGTLDCSGVSSGWGVKVNGSYWNITNMTIINNPTNSGLVFQTGGYNYVYNVTTSGHHDSGLQVYNAAHDDNVSYCHSNENYDTQNGGENADGFACKLSAGKNNKFDHCTANHNSDDGWDLYGQPYTVTITYCTSTNNGQGANGDGNGFKLGSSGQSVPHTCTNCVSNNNKGCGYTGNGNTGHITTTGSTGSGNVKGLWDRIY